MLAPSIHNLKIKEIENQPRLKQVNLNFILTTHMASINANSLEQMKVFIYGKISTPKRLAWNTNMAAMSLFLNINIWLNIMKNLSLLTVQVRVIRRVLSGKHDFYKKTKTFIPLVL